MRALLRTPRWIAFSVIVFALILGFGVLSRWQWSRAEEHRLERLAVEEQSRQSPVPITQILSPDVAPPQDLEWRPVSASGVFGATTLVRKRPLDGQNGFWVMTALRLDDGSWLWVNRGWLAATGGATESPSVPDAPSDIVTVAGRVRPSQTAPNPQPADLPTGQVTDADIAVFPAVDGPLFDAYIELYESSPGAQTGLVALEPPQIDDTKNVSYALQWIAFAVVGILGWLYFLRREARTETSEREPAQAN